MKLLALVTLLLVALVLSACSGGATPTTAPIAALQPTVVAEATPTAVIMATSTPTAAPTATPIPEPTATPLPEPTATPTAEPTATPTAEPTPTPAPAACDHPYLPVAAGRQWVYDLSGATSDRFTRSIVAVTDDGFTDRDDFASGTVREGSWRCQDGNLTALTPGTSPAVSAAGMRFEFTVQSNEGVTLPADLRPGKEWSQRLVYTGQQDVGGMTIESRNDLTTSCKAIREEQVTVPAGAFQALRVECNYVLSITVQGMPISVNSSGVNWYAPGVGMVQSTAQSDAGPTRIVLVETRP